MLKYKDTYFIGKTKDSKGIVSSNKDDNYIRCKNGIQIYRYNKNILVVQFNTVGIANNRLKELSAIGINLTPFQIGDNEQTYTFSESILDKVADIVKARKRIKKNYTDEQKLEIKLRLEKGRNLNR